MVLVVPTRARLSPQFPVASFAVQVPPRRLFELVFTTDPRLLHPRNQGHRRPDNFYTSRSHGLLRTTHGEAQYALPAAALAELAPAGRVYVALATYGSLDGGDPRPAIDLDQLHTLPYVLTGDLGRTLPRQRLGGRALLTWAADHLAPPAPVAAVAHAARYGHGLSGPSAVPSRTLPPALTTGSTIAVIAPAAYPTSGDAIPGRSGRSKLEDNLLSAVERSLGASHGVTIAHKPGYTWSATRNMTAGYNLAGSDADRLAELVWALEDDDVRAIVCVRGGFGSPRLLRGLQAWHDSLGGRPTPKRIVGYSDITALHGFVHSTLRWASIHGPMIQGSVLWTKPCSAVMSE